MPTLHYCGLVGIAHFINRRSIMIFINNGHPTILSAIPSKKQRRVPLRNTLAVGGYGLEVEY
ncbi:MULTISPECIES: hypothetical protein [unclassified Moorena]|uniref:hypothetical protein n=1 Tax=unclassified Moorena TaxID=2683338 RepID=UPI0013BDCA28|nr:MULTISPECIES: hypothetical protein [unclassified Moorena]NEP32763.1 hypothetical protein [Moorena sp. SIO3B2]NEQ11656.1 hypothetical protein [Moorena sp. SIO4E2]NEQ18244.1 hypothetical protein [Moorena sp. SIO3E2]